MSDQDFHLNKYRELRSIYKCHIESYIALFQLRTNNEEELNSIYKMIKTELIDSKKYLPQIIIKEILSIIPYNNRYIKSYLMLAKHISDDYHITEVRKIPIISNFLFNEEYGIQLDKFHDFEDINSENLKIHSENTIYKAIMDDDKDEFISFTMKEGFDINQKLRSKLYPEHNHYYKGLSLLELCCYHGAVNCFNYLRTMFDAYITVTCINFSFLGGNAEIIIECLKYQKPDENSMEYAIISHNIDFVTFLMNEYNIEIDLSYCGKYNNLDSFFVYFEQTNDINKCFTFSIVFDIPSLCEYFLSLGANIDEKDQKGNTVLHIAAEDKSLKLIELILSKITNVDAKNKYGYTALHNATWRNRKEVVELLLSYNANVNEKDYDRETALHIAAARNSKEIIKLLISHGANVNETDDEGQIPLHKAAYNNAKEVIEQLIFYRSHINEKDNNGSTALHHATSRNNKEAIEVLLSYGAKIDEKDYYGETALIIAAWRNQKEIVELLLSHGANANIKDNNGSTALHHATSRNNKEAIEVLLSYGAKIDEKDYYGYTALIIAAWRNQKEIVELLLSHGANANIKDKKGRTALHHASMENNKEIAEILLLHGAIVSEKDIYGQTPFYYAYWSGEDNVDYHSQNKNDKYSGGQYW
ncbi:ankyrin repeat protein, putative [Trichomonas vaginalis G3]|uniref:Ankyrin repeat protein, putative n=1 Tax=Trichomonas vaginalis (strain ATCC PRA-98 / G3) TaxID=412133 RepID=A2DLQ8_TRIV3|nr:ankyrin repeat and SOCS box-containing protein 4 family [Trichomonas vaginalis G3]EAY18691.1 ankyrin repeat protein, putative [Trichomonas vaginalis G3]KAI5522590.1 ankyrin repeat and SOCS box-containing protein 4 family [Trichomonas vaginalis G3]|eukprot:XP_001579677.1 ankyrin repeat protein [Trichomonas vaginalis G3]